jgi:hypothetical protein
MAVVPGQVAVPATVTERQMELPDVEAEQERAEAEQQPEGEAEEVDAAQRVV